MRTNLRDLSAPTAVTLLLGGPMALGGLIALALVFGACKKSHAAELSVCPAHMSHFELTSTIVPMGLPAERIVAALHIPEARQVFTNGFERRYPQRLVVGLDEVVAGASLFDIKVTSIEAR